MNERDFIVDMVDYGRLTTKEALIMCLKTMSLDDVRATIEQNELNGTYRWWLKHNCT